MKLNIECDGHLLSYHQQFLWRMLMNTILDCTIYFYCQTLKLSLHVRSRGTWMKFPWYLKPREGRMVFTWLMNLCWCVRGSSRLCFWEFYQSDVDGERVRRESERIEKGEAECVRRARNEVIQPSYFTSQQTNFLSRMMTTDSFYSTLLQFFFFRVTKSRQAKKIKICSMLVKQKLLFASAIYRLKNLSI